jgi:hypothetical protein
MGALALRAARIKTLIGTLVLGAVVCGAVLLLVSPGVARPAGRILASLGSAFDDERDDDQRFPVGSLDGIRKGLPVFLVDGEGRARPVAYVVRSEAGRAGPGQEPAVFVRFAPGERAEGPWRLRAYPPSRKLRAALDMAVTPEAATRFAADVAARMERLWTEAIMPEAEARFPEFLARIDPTKDTEARALLTGLSGDLMTRLRPMLDDLAGAVTGAVKREFDVLDKLGLGWKFLRGDAKGIKKKLMPIVERSARAWWAANQTRVLQATGAALHDNLDAMRAWAGGELFRAAREELLQPILATQRGKLEAEGEALLRHAADEFVESPDGGFRVRFAGMLRTQLLNKKTALLLLEREPR